MLYLFEVAPNGVASFHNKHDLKIKKNTQNAQFVFLEIKFQINFLNVPLSFTKLVDSLCNIVSYDLLGKRLRYCIVVLVMYCKMEVSLSALKWLENYLSSLRRLTGATNFLEFLDNNLWENAVKLIALNYFQNRFCRYFVLNSFQAGVFTKSKGKKLGEVKLCSLFKINPKKNKIIVETQYYMFFLRDLITSYNSTFFVISNGFFNSASMLLNFSMNWAANIA